MASSLNITSLTRAGMFLIAPESQGFPAVFVCSIPTAGAVPAGAIDTSKGFYLTAFGRRCTHLGCYVLPGIFTGQATELPSRDLVITCRCHFSSFDLAREAMNVQGPATDFLPRVALRAVDDPVTRVELISWVREVSVPYGVPFDGTSGQPPEKP